MFAWISCQWFGKKIPTLVAMRTKQQVVKCCPPAYAGMTMCAVLLKDPRLLPKEDNSTKATSCQVSYSGDDNMVKKRGF